MLSPSVPAMVLVTINRTKTRVTEGRVDNENFMVLIEGERVEETEM